MHAIFKTLISRIGTLNKKELLLLLTGILVISGVKLLIISKINYPWLFADEAVYLQTAYQIFFHGRVLPQMSFPCQLYPPGFSIMYLLPILFDLTPASTYKFMLSENVVVSYLIFGLSYFYLRKYWDYIEAGTFALLITFLPSVFPYGFVGMSEHLFILVSLIAFVIISRTSVSDSYIKFFLIGIIFAFLTFIRMPGLFFLGGYMVSLLLFHLSKSKSLFKLLTQVSSISLGFCIISGPYFIWKSTKGLGMSTSYNEGKYIKAFFSLFDNFENFKVGASLFVNEFLTIVILSFGFIIILLSVFFIIKKKDEKVFILYYYVFFTTIFNLIITISSMVLYNSQEPNSTWILHARYLDIIIPSIILLGLKIYKENNNVLQCLVLPINYLLKKKKQDVLVNATENQRWMLVIFIVLSGIIILCMPETFNRFPDNFSVWFAYRLGWVFEYKTFSKISALFSVWFKHRVGWALLCVPLLCLPVFCKHKRLLPFTLLFLSILLSFPTTIDIIRNSNYIDPRAKEIFHTKASTLTVYMPKNKSYIDSLGINYAYSLEFARYNNRKIKFTDDKKKIVSELPSYKMNSKINFGTEGNATQYQIEGWNRPENGFTWTNGKEASLIVPISQTQKDLSLKVTMYPLTKTKQLVNIVVNDKLLGNWNVLEQGKYEITIPKIDTDDFLTITFKLPNAITPKELNINNDTRVLGVAVQSMEITEKD